MSRHLVDPQLSPLLDAFPTIALSPEALVEMRNRPPFLPVDAAAIEKTELTTRKAPCRDGAPDVPVTVYRPKGVEGPLPCIFHIHGGGYVGGSVASMEGIHRPMAIDLQCVIVSVEYRLAPETRFPGNVEDCYAGLAWTFANAAEFGIDTGRIGVMGESAGGGLGAALALLARDRGEYRLTFQHLIYPMLDDRTCTDADPHPHVGEFIWTPHNNNFGWSAILGAEPGGEGVSPYCAAARADDLSNLPPTFISTGALDLFLEEDIEYARRLMRAGVPVELHVYPGAFHAFDIAVQIAEVAANARRDTMAALKRFLRPVGG